MPDLEAKNTEENEKPERRSLKNRKRPDNFTLSQEVAEDNLMLFLDFYEIYEDEFETEPEKLATKAACNKLIVAIRKGLLDFQADGTFTQTLKNGSKIEYAVLRGIAKTQNKHKKDESDDAARTRRMYSMMASLAGVGTEDMMKFEAVDLSTMECVGFLLSTV